MFCFKKVFSSSFSLLLFFNLQCQSTWAITRSPAFAKNVSFKKKLDQSFYHDDEPSSAAGVSVGSGAGASISAKFQATEVPDDCSGLKGNALSICLNYLADDQFSEGQDCTACRKDQAQLQAQPLPVLSSNRASSGPDNTAFLIGALAGPIAYLGGTLGSAAINASITGGAQNNMANAYRMGIDGCNSQVNNYLAYLKTTGQTNASPANMASLFNCNNQIAAGVGGMAGMGGMGGGSLYGGMSNPYIAGGYSPAMLGGMMGPYGGLNGNFGLGGGLGGGLGAYGGQAAYGGMGGGLGGSFSLPGLGGGLNFGIPGLGGISAYGGLGGLGGLGGNFNGSFGGPNPGGGGSLGFGGGFSPYGGGSFGLPGFSGNFGLGGGTSGMLPYGNASGNGYFTPGLGTNFGFPGSSFGGGLYGGAGSSGTLGGIPSTTGLASMQQNAALNNRYQTNMMANTIGNSQLMGMAGMAGNNFYNYQSSQANPFSFPALGGSLNFSGRAGFY
jgi:hypothetical protein